MIMMVSPPHKFDGERRRSALVHAWTAPGVQGALFDLTPSASCG